MLKIIMFISWLSGLYYAAYSLNEELVVGLIIALFGYMGYQSLTNWPQHKGGDRNE